MNAFKSTIFSRRRRVGLYRVALKKLTTPLTRPLAFAVSYAAGNLAGALADVVIDKMRNGVADLQIDESYGWLGGVYTPIRQFIVSKFILFNYSFFPCHESPIFSSKHCLLYYHEMKTAKTFLQYNFALSWVLIWVNRLLLGYLWLLLS